MLLWINPLLLDRKVYMHLLQVKFDFRLILIWSRLILKFLCLLALIYNSSIIRARRQMKQRINLQLATKWVEILRPKWTFWRFPDFKRGKYSFSSLIPSMQCCVTVRATIRKQQTPQLWMEGTGKECKFLCSLKLPYLNFVANCRLNNFNLNIILTCNISMNNDVHY